MADSFCIVKLGDHVRFDAGEPHICDGASGVVEWIGESSMRVRNGAHAYVFPKDSRVTVVEGPGSPT
jgi:hypothetical protein